MNESVQDKPAPCPIEVLRELSETDETHNEMRVYPSLLKWNEDGEIELY